VSTLPKTAQKMVFVVVVATTQLLAKAKKAFVKKISFKI
jgi:hypothetical protein